MADLRAIVRSSIREEALRDYLGTKYDTASEEEKNRLVTVLENRGEIDRESDRVLSEFIDHVASRDKRAERLKRASIAVVEIVLTVLIGIGVNQEAWVFVIGSGLVYSLLLVFSVLWID